MIRPIFILFIVFGFQSYGQSSKRLDSTHVFNLLNKANDYFNEAVYDSAIYYSDKAELLAKQKNYKLGLAYAYIKKTEIYIDKDDLEDAEKSIRKTQDLEASLKDSLVIAIAILQKAQVKMYQNKIPEALVYFEKCTKNYFKNHPSEYAALAYNDYGYACGMNGQLTEKAQQLFKALSIYENLPELNHGEIAIVYNNISTVYYELNQKEKAIFYAKKSIEHRKFSGEIDKLALSYCNLSQMYRGIDSAASEKYQKLCVEYAEKSKNQDRIIHAYITSALLASDADNREKAIEFEKKAIAVLEQNQNDLGMLAKRYLALGMHYKALNKDTNLTYSYLDKALKISKKIHDKSVISESYNQLSDYFLKINNYKEALNAQKSYYVYRDSIIKENTNSTIADLETKYETTKKEKEINLLTAENNISKQQKRTQTFLFLGILALIIISGLFLFFIYRNKLKTAQKLKELDALKSRFFANISHEFRTPLTLIKSPLQLLKQEETDVSKTKNLLMIEQHSNRMLSLVDQLLQLSKIDSGNLKLVLHKSNLSSFLETILEPYVLNANEAGFNFNRHIQKAENTHWFDKDVLEKIVTNLLSNTLKYTPKGGLIHFESKISENKLHFMVENKTEGIDAKDVSKLFDRFYQDKNTSEGVGIGLALVKELVLLYKGTITAEIKNQKLIFTVELPLEKELLTDVSIVSESDTEETILQTVTTNSEDLPILLVVDDNANIRMVLKDLLHKAYHILEASDGAMALKTAIKEVPDIIISDVMMPKINGFELTEALKQNHITASIPIILLTAKTSDEFRLKGLQFEADDYITKPFNHDILKTKIQQLIAVRQKLRERYSKELVLKPTDISITSADEKFIERLQSVLESELSNSNFTSDDFAKAISMSRMQLHRKLKMLLGVSATEFIRNERLKAATMLLKKDNVNISEIAYNVGFNDVSYFSKCFKETFGVTPSDYILNN